MSAPTGNAPAGAALGTTTPLSRNGSFSLLWLGEGVSVLGNTMTSALLPLLAVVSLDAGPLWMGLITAAAWLPWLVIGLPAGAWVDRLPAKRVMIVADVVAAASLASVPAAWALDQLTLTHLVVAALLNGACTVFFRTAYVVFLPQVVAPEQLEAANARLFGTESAMQLVGPGAGGLLAQWLSAALGLLVDAVTFLVSAVCLWRIKPAHARPPSDSGTASEPLWARIREGVAYVRSDRYLPWFVLIGGLSNFGLTGYTTLFVLHLVRDLDLEPAQVGLTFALAACGGLPGAVIATWLSRRLGNGRASTILLLCSGPVALLVGLGQPGWGVAVPVLGSFLAGLFIVAGNVIRGAWRQRYVPPEIMGRVMTTMQMINFGTMPLAGLAAGWLGGSLGVRETILLMAAIHCLACFIVLISPLRPLRELPGRPPAAADGPAPR
ncbi:MFS transporter [Promicromonospora vindobonensis]|uniref:MFS transporter n=1 Tax=Promicromonospora vindobonensis TaxID=195748 RepID=A0ABW5VVZ9_9MICO